MGRDDWFRNTEWNAEIEARFQEKLRRARDKPQYLRIQAGCLTEKYPHDALRLLGQFFQLGENLFWAQAYLDQGHAYLSLGDKESALNSFRLALQRERDFPNVVTQAWIDYTFLVVEERAESFYEDALEVLKSHPPTSGSFPVQAFCWFAALAMLSDLLQNPALAKESATKALEWSEVTHSGYRYHAQLGLVGTQWEETKKKLRQIAQ